MDSPLVAIFISFVLGSLAGMYFRNRKKFMAVVRIRGHNYKMSNYRDTVRLMRTILHFDEYKQAWNEEWEYYRNTDEALYDLKKKWSELYFHAPAEILAAVKGFIENPRPDKFNEAVSLMRKDMFNGNSGGGPPSPPSYLHTPMTQA